MKKRILLYCQLVTAASLHAQTYTVTDMGSLGSAFSYGYGLAMNASGTVVGESHNTSENASHATLFQITGALDLGSTGSFGSHAYAVGDAGVIVGYGAVSNVTTNNITQFHALRFSGTGSNNTDLGTLGGNLSYAKGINSDGIIVGTSALTPPSLNTVIVNHAFIYRNGSMIDLNTLIPTEVGVILNDAVEINDPGQIAVNGSRNGAPRVFRLEPAGLTPPPPIVTYSITAKASPKSKGTVKGGGSIATGTTATLTAQPKRGFKFINWTEGKKIVSRKKNYTFTVSQARTLVAHFK